MPAFCVVLPAALFGRCQKSSSTLHVLRCFRQVSYREIYHIFQPGHKRDHASHDADKPINEITVDFVGHTRWCHYRTATHDFHDFGGLLAPRSLMWKQIPEKGLLGGRKSVLQAAQQLWHDHFKRCTIMAARLQVHTTKCHTSEHRLKFFQYLRCCLVVLPVSTTWYSGLSLRHRNRFATRLLDLPNHQGHIIQRRLCFGQLAKPHFHSANRVED
mmetsp:Transcript_47073/g.90831  ORF Transcript_47073/g.90831 Transcript_47073/m.90831 type:complete len:215 (+) Transcript_47073:523-1167(+)